MGKRMAVVLMAIGLIVPVSGGAAARTMADVWRQSAVEFAQQAGIDPGQFLGSTVEVTGIRADGSRSVRLARLADWIAERGSGIAVAAAPGVAGLPEVTAGDFLHACVDFGEGVPPCYSVTTSAVVPATPPVTAPPTGPLPGFFEFGGPLVQVKGGPYFFGLHIIGSLVGLSVDTAESGPYLPDTTYEVIPDDRIDFVGHVGFLEAFHICASGSCITAGAMYADGLAIWDTEEPSLPVVP